MTDTSHPTLAVFEPRPPSAVDGSRARAEALATTVSRRLHAAGLPVTSELAVRFADAVILMGPVSHRRLYFIARTVFVSDPAHLPAFDEHFASVLADGPVDGLI